MKKNVLLALIGLMCQLLYGQIDTKEKNEIILDYYSGQEILFKENLQLAAAYYEVDIAKAEIIQAKLWSNPRFVWNADLYSVATNTYMNNTLQRLVQIEYTFSIGGKHTNNVKLKKLGAELSEYQFIDFVRGLNFEYSEHYHNLYGLREKAILYESKIKDYETLLSALEKKYELGLISLNELIRIRSEVITFQTEKAEIDAKIEEEYKNIRLLLNLPLDSKIKLVDRNIDKNINPVFNEIFESAKQNRPDLIYAEKLIKYNERNLKLQISSAIPDVKFGYQPHDRGSNYQRPYAGIVLEWDVPLFNRNQGEIKKAKLSIDQSTKELDLMNLKIENEITEAFNQFNIHKNILNEYPAEFISDLDNLSKNATENYIKKNISLLEYIDIQRNYIETKSKYIDNYCNFLNAVSYTNFISGKELLK